MFQCVGCNTRCCIGNYETLERCLPVSSALTQRSFFTDVDMRFSSSWLLSSSWLGIQASNLLRELKILGGEVLFSSPGMPLHDVTKRVAVEH